MKYEAACLLLILLLSHVSCSLRDEEPVFIGRQAEYPLHQTHTAFGYQGKVSFKELPSEEVEVTVLLEGEKGDEAYYFPTHLHFRCYGTPEAPMAAMLNPVDIRSLKSETVVSKLTNGEQLAFDDLEFLEAHIKVHLAEDGPDYNVILVAGNIGNSKCQ